MKKIVCLFITVFGYATVNAAPILINGSLTGPITNGDVPTGWNITTPSPDTLDENNNAGVPGLGSFAATPSSSQDGGTWVGIAREGAFFVESFGQTITGFLAGTSYDLFWQHANFGYSDYSGTNSIEVLLDGNSIGSGPALNLGTSWVNEMINFTASATTHHIDFRLLDTTKSYHFIDGITLSETNAAPVPGPAGIILLGLGLIGLRFSRQQS